MSYLKKFNKFIKESSDNIPFSNIDKKGNSDTISKYANEWKDKYPELKIMKLESDYIDKKWNWLFSINKKHDNINIDLFIEIEKSEYWDIRFELIMECEDEYLNNNIKDKSNIQDEIHYEKNNLDWEELNSSLSKICEYIRDWNYNFHKENGFYPLID